LGGSKGLGVGRSHTGVVTAATAARNVDDREKSRDRTQKSRAKKKKKKKADEKAKERMERDKVDETKER